ncbi:MAG: DUF881 domain-containing protein [Clostridia bacterium]|nr:DUF881 domain-containing protein [Clostridia bacterium]
MRKKGEIVMTITIGIACFILSMIIFMQFKVVHETDVTSIDTMRAADLQTELASWKAKYEEVDLKYQEIEATLKKYKEETTSDKEVKSNLEEELKNLEMILGKTDVEGKGIIITLKENEETTEKISADELLVIVNYLRDAGAEAISVNDQRVVNQTDFALIRDGFIKVNSQRIVYPYEIKAIGNPDYLKSSLIGTGGYEEEIKALGQEITIEEKNKIKILKYTGEMNTRYIEEK